MGEAVSAAIEARAEILKLARLLGRDPSELEYLSDVPVADIRALREQVTETLFSSQGQLLSRLAAASKLLPVGLVAQLGERIFGPVISARIAGLLEPERAIELACKLPVPFLADVAVELDPRRAPKLIAGIPPERIAAVSDELIRRGEYVTMGRFVGYLSDAALRVSVGRLEPLALLQVGFVMEQKERLPDVIGLVDPATRDAMLSAAIDAGLRDEALDLITYLDDEQRVEAQRMIDSLEQAPELSRQAPR